MRKSEYFQIRNGAGRFLFIYSAGTCNTEPKYRWIDNPDNATCWPREFSKATEFGNWLAMFEGSSLVNSNGRVIRRHHTEN
jgi:hypothetical protein